MAHVPYPAPLRRARLAAVVRPLLALGGLLAPALLAAAEGPALRGLRSASVIDFAPAERQTPPVTAGAGSDLRLPPGALYGLRDRAPVATGRAAYAWSDALSGSVEAGPAPRDPWTASTAVAGQLVRAFAGGLGLGLGLRQPQTGTPLLALGVRQDFGGLRGGYTLYSDRGDPLAAPSHRFALAFDYGRGSRVGLSYTEGRDSHQLAAPALAGAGGRDWSLSGMHSFAPHWALTYDLVNSESATARRQGLHFGLRHSF